MDFIADYVCYHDNYEIPRNYVYWSAFGLLSAVINRKVHFLHGDIDIPAGPLFILMVGPQGNGKSTPCKFARKMFTLVCPDLEIGASTQSAEEIVKTMSQDTFVRGYTNENGEQTEVRPYAFFINEFKDFIAYAPVRMLNFLGNIYDENPFRARTISRGLEDIVNPCLTVLACENPDQLSKFMKNDIFTGGLARRFILVNEPHYSEPKPFIPSVDQLPLGHPVKEAWLRVRQRLVEVRKVVGLYKWSAEGKKFYEPWYVAKQRSLQTQTNPLMAGYLSTKHIQLFKICMFLDAVSDKPMLLFTGDLLQLGLAFLDALEKNMPRLSMAAGRNVMAISYQKALEMLEADGGLMPKKLLMKRLETELNPFETAQAIRYLEETDQIIVKCMKIPNAQGVGIERWMVLSPKRWFEGLKKGEWKEATPS